MPLLAPCHSINLEYEDGYFTGVQSCPLLVFHSIVRPQRWAAALTFVVIHRLACGHPSLGALERTKVNGKLFLSLSLFVSFFPLHLNQKFLISPVPLGRDFGICQSPQACSGPRASEPIPER